VPKNFFPEQINFEDHPPPSPKKFWSVYHLRGQKNFSDIPKFFETSYKFSRYHTISHEINTTSHKIYRICPILFYNKPILPDCGANIARLSLFAQQTGGAGAPPPPPPRQVRPWFLWNSDAVHILLHDHFSIFLLSFYLYYVSIFLLSFYYYVSIFLLSFYYYLFFILFQYLISFCESVPKL
jgi:hypothetical protein